MRSTFLDLGRTNSAAHLVNNNFFLEMQDRKVDRESKSLDKQCFTPIVCLATIFVKLHFSLGTADKLMIFT